MTHFNDTLKTNPLQSRADWVAALEDLLDPVYALMAAEAKQGRVRLGVSGSVYNEPRREVEGFMRTLWGVGPLCSTSARAKQYRQYFEPATAGILAGIDPDSPFYWGELEDYDQLFVEMGALATFLILTRDFFYQQLPVAQQRQLYAWLNQINQHTIPKNNWLFFRVLVNTFFQYAGLTIPEGQPQADLDALDSYYLADGWYFDGYKNQIDYYIPFGMQYYQVLYSALAYDPSEPHVAKFKARAAVFGQTFKDWFVKDGTAVPFGRSQTYRFAQAGWWAVAALAHTPLEGMTAAEAKYLLSANLHQWFNRPIFSSDGLLTVGYGYSNLVMAEGYNAPGSPYWALKSFIHLALPDDDPFWTLPETVPAFPERALNPHARMLLIHSADGQELQDFTAGQHSHEHAQGESKYEKFVYSTTFGFSVKKGSVLPKQGAFDNTLAVSESAIDFRTVFGYADYAVHSDYVYGKWQPWPDVMIKTFIVPLYPWHLRLHVIETARPLNLIEGSFSAPIGGQILPVALPQAGVFYQSAVGTVGILALSPQWQAQLEQPEPNTNMLYPLTKLPELTASLQPGHYQLAAACLGAAHDQTAGPQPVAMSLVGKQLTFTVGSAQKTVTLRELND